MTDLPISAKPTVSTAVPTPTPRTESSGSSERFGNILQARLGKSSAAPSLDTGANTEAAGSTRNDSASATEAASASASNERKACKDATTTDAAGTTRSDGDVASAGDPAGNSDSVNGDGMTKDSEEGIDASDAGSGDLAAMAAMIGLAGGGLASVERSAVDATQGAESGSIETLDARRGSGGDPGAAGDTGPGGRMLPDAAMTTASLTAGATRAATTIRAAGLATGNIGTGSAASLSLAAGKARTITPGTLASGTTALARATGGSTVTGAETLSALPLTAIAGTATQAPGAPFATLLASSLGAASLQGLTSDTPEADIDAGLATDLSAAPGAAPPWSGLASAHLGSPTLSVTTPVASPTWATDFSQTLQIMVRNGSEEAQIRLNPEALGPISVSLSMNGGQLSLVLTAAASETRALIEAQIPQLRESLGASGLQLADAQVHEGSPGMSDSGREAWQGTNGQSGGQPSGTGAGQGGSPAASERDGGQYGVSDPRTGKRLAQASIGLRRVDTFA